MSIMLTPAQLATLAYAAQHSGSKGLIWVGKHGWPTTKSCAMALARLGLVTFYGTVGDSQPGRGIHPMYAYRLTELGLDIVLLARTVLELSRAAPASLQQE